MKKGLLSLAAFLTFAAAAMAGVTPTSQDTQNPPKITPPAAPGELYVIEPMNVANYQGGIFDVLADLSNVTKDHKIKFKFRSNGARLNYTFSLYLSKGGAFNRTFAPPAANQVCEMELDLDPANWQANKQGIEFGPIKAIGIWSRDFKAPYSLEVSDFEFVLPEGNQVIAADPGADNPVVTSVGIPADWKTMGNNAVWMAGGPEVTNGRIDMTASWTALENKYSGIGCRIRQTGNNPYWCYWVFFRPMTRTFEVTKYVSNKLDPDFQKKVVHMGKVPEWKANQQYKVQVEFTGNVVKGWIDGKLLFYVIDDAKPYDRGTFAIELAPAGTLHELKIHDFVSEQEVKDAELSYPVPPERGEVNGTEQAYWGLRTQGEPAIIFAFKEKHFIRRAVISADAVPTHNFSSAIISVSSNGQDWQSVASIPNDNASRARAKYDLGGEVNAAGRYFKISFARSKFDNAVEVSKITLFADDSLASLASEQQAKKHRWKRPAALPTATFTANDPANCLLQVPGLSVAVARSNGAVTGIRADGKAEIAGAYDLYFLENRAGVTAATELEDQVTSVQTGDGTLELIARNPKMPGIEIGKRYAFSADRTRLSKKVTFRNDRTDNAQDLFLTLRSEVFLDGDYRADGFYFGSDWGLGGRMAAKQVNFDVANQPHAAGNSKIGFFINRSYSANLGQFLFKVNDRHVSGTISMWYEKENLPMTYTIDGWKIGMATLQLFPGVSTSLEYQFLKFSGDDFDFYKAWRAVPEMAERYAEFPPVPWMADLKCIVGANMYPESEYNFSMFDGDGFVVGLANGPNRWGDWIGKGSGPTSHGDLYPCEVVAEEFQRLHDRFPYAKLGMYCWAWTGKRESNAFQQHPEWFIVKDKNNRDWCGYGSGSNMNFLRLIGIPESAQALLDGAAEIKRELKADLNYLDGGNGGTNVIDWPNLRLTQIYDWDDFHTNLKRTIRSIDPQGMIFFNAHSEWNYDLGYHEGINCRFTPDLWRDSADALYTTKLRQQLDPLRKVSPINWLDGQAQYYANYCIGLGLVPAIGVGMLPRLAYVSAAYENRDLEFLDARFSPDWRFNPEAVTEIHSFRHGNAGVLAVIDHNRTKTPTTLTVDRASLGLDPAKPLYVWNFTLAPIAPRLKSGYGLPEPLNRKIAEATGFWCDMVGVPRGVVAISAAGKTFSGSFTLQPEMLEYFVFTEGPAAIWSLNGKRTNFWQPATGHVTLESVPGRERITVTQKGAGKVESIVAIPNDWNGVKVANGELKLVFGLYGQLYAVVALAGDGETATLTPEAHQRERLVNAGKPMTVTKNGNVLTLPPDFKAGTVLILAPSGALVYAADYEGKAITLPEQLEDGTYTVLAEAAEANGSGSANVGKFTVANHFRHYQARSKWVRGRERERKPSIVEVTPDRRTVQGLELLATGFDSHDSYDSTSFVEIDSERLSVTAGALDFPATYAAADDHSFAGFEFANLRQVTLKCRSNMKNVYGESITDNFPYANAESFGGLMIDYHTPQGYVKRVALSLGQISSKRTYTRPDFGAAKVPDEFALLDNLIAKGTEGTYTLNLMQWAPQDWDGQVWLIIGTDRTGAQRHLGMEVLPAQGAAATVKNMDLKPYAITVPRIPNTIAIDGKFDPAEWQNARKITEFHRLGTLEEPSQKSECYLGMDDKRLYIAFRLFENENAFAASSAKLWENDGVDLGFEVSPKIQHQLIIDVNGKCYEADNDTTSFKTLGVKQTPWKHVEKATIENGVCTIEIAIDRPECLQPEHGRIRFNAARYRLGKGTVGGNVGEITAISPMTRPALLDPKLYNTLEW